MKKITSLVAMLLGLWVATNAQNIITVDNGEGSNAQFNNLQSAISAASSGDIIHIIPSETNYGDITIEKKLTLIGFAHSDKNKRTMVDGITLTTGADDTRITGLVVTDSYYVKNNTVPLTGLIVENCLLEELYFANAGADGIVIRGNILNYVGFSRTTSLYSNALITNNLILREVVVLNYQSITVKNNIFLNPVGSSPIYNYSATNGSVTVQNNIFYFDSNSTFDPNFDGVNFENCLAYNNGSGNVASLNGTDNLNNQNPLFVEDNDNATFEPDIDDYRLQSSSPALNAGVNGEDIGLYGGGSFIFNNQGFSNGIPTVSIQAISTTVEPGQNLNVIISTTNH
ncbi:right-handed parallel beta-helix repeat-containing protein [Pareuzebyella sediminis]|uniref:hypothetical protein n=1 Tax=Pareuzebyella sediminis TaxID=2607998 RepID=UPI0011EC360A|nr:hypothetical protein [Pareuzebyella sediminis]